jgi:hypothetical protein
MGVDPEKGAAVGTTTRAHTGANLATLDATPNPLPAGKDLGVTTISWDTGDKSFAQIYISENGGPDTKMFAEGAKNSKQVKWIKTGHSYEFRLYAGKEHQLLLAKVLVTRADK